MKTKSILLLVLIASAMIQVFVYFCIYVFVYLCIFVFVSLLILAMFQDQALVASKHLLVETKDSESGQDEDGTDYQLVFSSLPTWFFETTTTKPWHDPNSHRVVVHPNDPRRTQPHRRVVYPKDGTDYYYETEYKTATTTKPWHDPNSHRVVVHPNDRTRPHRNVVHPKDRIHYDDHVRVEVRGPDFG